MCTLRRAHRDACLCLHTHTCTHACTHAPGLPPAPGGWGQWADSCPSRLLSSTVARRTQGSHRWTPSLLAQVPALLPFDGPSGGSLTGWSSQQVHWREACAALSMDSGTQAGTPGSRNRGQGLRAEWRWGVACGASWGQGQKKGGLYIQGVGVLGAQVPGDADIHQCLKLVSQNGIFTTYGTCQYFFFPIPFPFLKKFVVKSWLLLDIKKHSSIESEIGRHRKPAGQ